MTTAEPRQRDLLTRRWRKVRAPEPSETQFHIALVEHLRLRLRPEVLFWHTPNGGLRDKRTAAKLRAMGTLAGVPDLIFLWKMPGIPHLTDDRVSILFLELKKRKKDPSDNQDAFSICAMACGAAFEVARSLNDALAVLDKHGLLKRTIR